jgi:hypothetical protein
VRAQSIFWLGRPWLFRPVIKGLLFFVSFVFSNSIYFAAMFGPTSCFFSRTGFQGPQFLPWWVSDPAEPPTLRCVQVYCFSSQLFNPCSCMPGSFLVPITRCLHPADAYRSSTGKS